MKKIICDSCQQEVDEAQRAFLPGEIQNLIYKQTKIYDADLCFSCATNLQKLISDAISLYISTTNQGN